MKTKQNSIRFTKMHGLGNDFVIINALNPTIKAQDLPITDLGNRHTGIGFDQLLVIEPSNRADFFCRIFNADGSEAEQCGNGLRCIARFIREEGLHKGPSFNIETKAGVYPVLIEDNDHIRVSMGAPLIQEKRIELELASDSDPVHKHNVFVSILSLGNPHAILRVDSIDTISPNQLGPKISAHFYFPDGANVGFMQIVNREHLRLRTFERGAGETYACGSNACAAVVTGIANGWLSSRVKVEFSYGVLIIEWEGGDSPVHMMGPATRVFSGEINA